MPADSNIGINLSVNGAGAAAQALGSVSQGMAQIGAAHNDLAGKFGQRFQHIGLMLFVGEALRASGVGMETRQVINLMNLALTSMVALGGAASGGIMLIVAALVTLVGITEKIIHHHKDHFEALGKVVDAENKQIEAINKTIAPLQSLTNSHTQLSPAMKAVLDANIKLRDIYVNERHKNYLDEIADLKTLIEKEEDQKKKLEEEAGQLTITTRLKITLAAAVLMLTNNHIDLTKWLGNLGTTLADVNKKLAEHKEKLAEANAAVETFGNKAGLTWQQISLNAAKTNDEMQKWINNNKDKGVDMFKQFEQHAKHAFDTINQQQSMAFSKAIVEGKSFADETAHLWRDLAEQVIAQIEAMMVKYALLTALTGGTMDTGGFVGKALGFGGGHASGGSAIVDKPTLFLAGEGGEPEMASFTPLSKIGGGREVLPQGTSNAPQITVGNVTTHVHGIKDPDVIASIVGRKIIERIRGLGEINYARVS